VVITGTLQDTQNNANIKNQKEFALLLAYHLLHNKSYSKLNPFK